MKQATKKRILFLVTKSNFGGAQRYVHDIATRLPPERFAVSVAFGGEGALGRKLAERGIPTVPLPFLARDVHPLKDWRAFSRIVGLLREERPDILHLSSSKAGGLGALAGRLAGVPRIVFTSHGLAYDEDRGALAKALIFIATWCTFFFAHVVICISEDTFERARRLPLVGRRVRLIHNGVDAFPLLPRDEARIRISKACGERAGALWIGTIAEFVKNKGLSYALDAFAALSGRIEANLLLVGDGDDKRSLETRAGEKRLNPNVCMPGYIPEARELLSALDIFVLPSVKEGLPYVLLEAGLARLPVVASDIAGVRDIVENGVSGILVPPRDTAALAAAIETLATQPALRARLGEALSEKVSRLFPVSAMVGKTVAAYLS